MAAELGGDGARVATAGKGANVWDADSDSPPVALVPASTYVDDVAFSPDGERVVTAGHDDLARIWDPDGTLIRTLAGHTDIVR